MTQNAEYERLLDAFRAEAVEARKRLTLSHTPDALPQRADKIEVLQRYISAVASVAPNHGSLFMAGVPGTGKSASVAFCLRHASHALPHLRVIQLKCAEHPRPDQTAQALFRLVFGRETTLKAAEERLTAAVTAYAVGPETPPLLLVLDEVDAVQSGVTTSSKLRAAPLLHAMFRWPQLNSAVGLVMIANTISLAHAVQADLAELAAQQVAKDKLAVRVGAKRSRAGRNRATVRGAAASGPRAAGQRPVTVEVAVRAPVISLEFPAYLEDELLSIITQRVQELPISCRSPLRQGVPLFLPKALLLAARRVKHRSGDARAVMRICREALGFAVTRVDISGKPPFSVTVSDIQAASSVLYASSDLSSSLATLPLAHVCMLVAVSALARITPHPSAAAVEPVFNAACRAVGLTAVRPDACLGCIRALAQQDIIATDSQSLWRFTQVQLAHERYAADALQHALSRSDPLLASLSPLLAPDAPAPDALAPDVSPPS
jgi:Cdc6-like AAA superfamily ATPase